MTIIPAINVTTYKDAEKYITDGASFSEWIHIDIVDGKFASNVTWGSPDELMKMVSENKQLAIIKFEIHLMIKSPENVVENWAKTGLVRRIIVHHEAITNSSEILKICNRYNIECMIAINPETDVETLSQYYENQFTYFQILGVRPGHAGQKIGESVLNKIKILREKVQHATIEVDGGVNNETALIAKKYGANILISASYIFKSQNPKEKFEELKNI